MKKNKKRIIIYTMTGGLGDYLIMGDLMHKVEKLLPETQCLMVHRNNPHIKLWPYGDFKKCFFNVYSPWQFVSLVLRLRASKKQGYSVFGLQMTPGSVQGFRMHALLKSLRVVDYIVDFNLINADIITPPKGDYVLDRHLNQINTLFDIEISPDLYTLNLPVHEPPKKSLKKAQKVLAGVHPWSRRGHLECFVWPFASWAAVIKYLIEKKGCDVIVFGKDKKFDEFRGYLKESLGDICNCVKFSQSKSVSELIQTVSDVDLLLSVNTSAVHIGYALNKKMIILGGPSLDTWTPKKSNIAVVHDDKADFQGSDKYSADDRFPSVSRIDCQKVLDVIDELEFN